MCESLGRGLCVSTTLVEWPERQTSLTKILKGAFSDKRGPRGTGAEEAPIGLHLSEGERQ